jgi:hypothetical protein
MLYQSFTNASMEGYVDNRWLSTGELLAAMTTFVGEGTLPFW